MFSARISKLAPYFKSPSFRVRVGPQKIIYHVHKDALMVIPYFRSLFSFAGAESAAEEVDLDDTADSVEAWEKILEFVYVGSYDGAGILLHARVYAMAERLCMEELKQAVCEGMMRDISQDVQASSSIGKVPAGSLIDAICIIYDCTPSPPLEKREVETSSTSPESQKPKSMRAKSPQLKNSSQTTYTFGSASPPSGSRATRFGQAAAPDPSASAFGSSRPAFGSSGSGFGSSTSAFGSPGPEFGSSTSAFGSPGSGFGSSTSAFRPSKSVFGSSASAPVSGLFGSPVPASAPVLGHFGPPVPASTTGTGGRTAGESTSEPAGTLTDPMRKMITKFAAYRLEMLRETPGFLDLVAEKPEFIQDLIFELRPRSTAE